MPVRSVLVVDDNPLVRRMLCELLTREGDFDVAEGLRMGGKQLKRLNSFALT